MNIIIAIANILLFPETKNKKQEKNVLIHLKSCKLIFLLPNFPKHNYQNIACDFLAKIFFLSEKSSIFADSNKVDTPSLLHRYSIASPSFRWSIYGEVMGKRWINIEERAEENTRKKQFAKKKFTNTFGVL